MCNGVNQDIPELCGINLKKAIDMLQLDWSTFRHILFLFLKNNIDTIDKIDQTIKDDDCKRFNKIIHKIKGSSGNIGAESLYNIAFQLNKESKADNISSVNDIDFDLLDNFKKELNTVLDSLKSIYDKSEIDRIAELGDSKGNSVFDLILYKFRDALEISNPVESQRFLEEIKGHLNKEIYESLKQKISDYDFDDAIDILNSNL